MTYFPEIARHLCVSKVPHTRARAHLHMHTHTRTRTHAHAQQHSHTQPTRLLDWLKRVFSQGNVRPPDSESRLLDSPGDPQHPQEVTPLAQPRTERQMDRHTSK